MDRTKTLFVILLYLSFMVQGCVMLALGTGAAVGAGTVAYMRGELQTDYAAPLDQTWLSTDA